jgi:MHS family proline/betaine transporter-like MFS transporter
MGENCKVVYTAVLMKALTRRLVTASSLGTILEWYDFSLFAYLTPVLAKLFFPQERALTALMLTYAIFAIGFFVRPLGAILFGHLGDRIGRKKTLAWTILLMSLPTFLMGLLPTYQSIGIAAPLLLILLRICQGLSAGGESTGAVLFVLESLPSKHRGFWGGLLWSMTGVGMLLGSSAALIVTHYSQNPWAWRIPFLLGILTGIVAYFLRKRVPESVMFENALENNTLTPFPLWEGIRKYKHEMLTIMGLYVLSAMITYLIFIFMPGYAANILGLPLDKTTLISTLSFLCVTLLVPLGGYLSDRVGRKACLRWAAVGYLVLSYPLFWLISQGSVNNFIIAQLIFVMLAACFQGALTATILELLPTSVRYSVAAVGYNVSYSIFGGTAPLVAAYMVSMSGNTSAPGLYLVFGALVAFIAVNKIRTPSRLQLT